MEDDDVGGGCLVFLVEVAAVVAVVEDDDVDVTLFSIRLALAKICCVSLSALSHGKVRFFCVTF